MESRILRIEEKISKIEESIIETKIEVSRMQEVDNNIFSKLRDIATVIMENKESFEKHDEKEMVKYSIIDARLIKIERMMYTVMGAFALFQALNAFEMIHIGN